MTDAVRRNLRQAWEHAIFGTPDGIAPVLDYAFPSERLRGLFAVALTRGPAFTVDAGNQSFERVRVAAEMAAELELVDHDEERLTGRIVLNNEDLVRREITSSRGQLFDEYRARFGSYSGTGLGTTDWVNRAPLDAGFQPAKKLYAAVFAVCQINPAGSHARTWTAVNRAIDAAVLFSGEIYPGSRTWVVMGDLPAQLPIVGPGNPVRPRLGFSEAVAELDYQSRVFANMAWGFDAFEPHWRTPDVVALARTIYAERAGHKLPILADALQEAGCETDLPQRLRRMDPAEWVRGESIVDLCVGLRPCGHGPDAIRHPYSEIPYPSDPGADFRHLTYPQADFRPLLNPRTFIPPPPM